VANVATWSHAASFTPPKKVPPGGALTKGRLTISKKPDPAWRELQALPQWKLVAHIWQRLNDEGVRIIERRKRMSTSSNSRNSRNISFCGLGTIVLFACIPNQVLGASLTPSHTTSYRPIQSISYKLGTKVAQGYFVQDAGACQLVLMIGENAEPEIQPIAVTRIRIALGPDQSATFDSEGSPSLTVRCAHDTASVLINLETGEQVAARQSAARHERQLVE